MLFNRLPTVILVVAQSGRMLTQMLMVAGFKVVVVDGFADCDTRQLALDYAQVASLALADLQPAVERLAAQHVLTHMVYGSGLEAFADSLWWLQHRFQVLGNSAQVFEQFLDKSAFFQNLSDLAIAAPETVFQPPNTTADWLLKPYQSAGGLGIRRCQCVADLTVVGYYWQRQLKGQALSALFVAAEGRVKVLGFNRQWTLADSFVFAGISNAVDVSAAVQRQVESSLQKLAGHYDLRGLGSLDFILQDDCCYLLELNPRIPASAQLYGKSAFSAHALACLGEWQAIVLQPAAAMAYQIVFAAYSLTVADDLVWPDWVVDRPVEGAFIHQGQPICSIIAAGKNARQVEQCLQQRQLIIEQFF